MKTTTKLAMVTVMLSGLLVGGCVADDSEDTSEITLESISDGEHALEVRTLGFDATGEPDAFELVYRDSAGQRSALASRPLSDEQLNADAVALLAQLPEDFRALVLASPAADSIGDLLRKAAWMTCVNWCLFIDGHGAFTCTVRCCADPNVAEICD